MGAHQHTPMHARRPINNTNMPTTPYLAAADVPGLHLGDGRLRRRALHELHEPAAAPRGDLHVHDLGRWDGVGCGVRVTRPPDGMGRASVGAY